MPARRAILPGLVRRRGGADCAAPCDTAKEEEERKLRKAEYEAGVADGFNDGINTAKKDTVRLHIAKSSWFDRRLLSGTILTSIFPDKRCRDQFSFPAEYR